MFDLITRGKRAIRWLLPGLVVKRWLLIDKQVSDLESQIKEIKKVKKELMPEITQFMVTYNISDLNTENGKLKCQERKTKKEGTKRQCAKHNADKLIAVLSEYSCVNLIFLNMGEEL